MKKIILTSLLSLAFVVSAHATTYIDVNVDLHFFDSSNTSHTNQFNLLDAGYNPDVSTITSASAIFAFSDIKGGRESFTIDLGGNLFNQGSFWLLLALPESVTANALFTLDQTGILSYTVNCNSGDFQLLGSTLVAQASPRNVPDAGVTALLLGMGVIGIFVAKYRLGSA